MRIMVTGSGLIGAYSARALQAHSHDVVLFDHRPNADYVAAVAGRSTRLEVGDVRNVDALAATISRHQSEVVVHTAGALTGSFQSDVFASFATNVSGTLCVAEAARRSGSRRLIMCSSLAVYDFSIGDEEIGEDHPLAPQSLYDHSKAVAEAAARPFCLTSGVELVVLRFAGVYGPGEFSGGAWLGKRLHDLMLGARAHRRLQIDSAELGTNEYLYVKDAAQAIVAACAASVSKEETINVGPGRLTTATAVGQAIASAYPGTEVSYLDRDATALPPFLDRLAPLAITKAKRVLRFEPQYGRITDGIKDYAEEILRVESHDRA